jgi:hypothetical protein
MGLHGKQSEFGEDALLSEVQASDLLCLSMRTLQAWRGRSIGPPFIKAGRVVRYRFGDLVAWIEANRVRPASERTAVAAMGARSEISVSVKGGR